MWVSFWDKNTGNIPHHILYHTNLQYLPIEIKGGKGFFGVELWFASCGQRKPSAARCSLATVQRWHQNCSKSCFSTDSVLTQTKPAVLRQPLFTHCYRVEEFQIFFLVPCSGRQMDSWTILKLLFLIIGPSLFEWARWQESVDDWQSDPLMTWHNYHGNQTPAAL